MRALAGSPPYRQMVSLPSKVSQVCLQKFQGISPDELLHRMREIMVKSKRTNLAFWCLLVYSQDTDSGEDIGVNGKWRQNRKLWWLCALAPRVSAASWMTIASQPIVIDNTTSRWILPQLIDEAESLQSGNLRICHSGKSAKWSYRPYSSGSFVVLFLFCCEEFVLLQQNVFLVQMTQNNSIGLISICRKLVPPKLRFSRK